MTSHVKPLGSPLPGMEVNDYPVPELPVLPQPTELPNETEPPRFLKIRQFLAEKALDRLETKYLEQVRHDTVIRASALGAQLRRGFRLEPATPGGKTKEPEHLRPITARERMTSGWRQGQVRRLSTHHHREHDATLLNLAEKTDWKTLLPANYDSLPIDKKRWADLEAKRKVRRTPRESILGSQEHLDEIHGVYDSRGRVVVPRTKMPRAALKDQEGRIITHNRATWSGDDLQRSLDEGTQGSTLFGRNRSRKIAKRERAIFKTQRKIDNLDRLAYLSEQEKERKKPIPDQQKLDELQYEFAEKWADDIHRQLTRREPGRAVIRDKGRRIRDASKA